MTRIKLHSWDACVDDCIKAIELEKSNMKAYYYLAQAQLALHHPNEAFNSAMTAYEECVRTHSSSTSNVSSLVLQTKKEKWESKEKDRLRRRSDLLRELEDNLRRASKFELQAVKSRLQRGEISDSEAAEETVEIQSSTQRKIGELESVFAIADPENMQRRVRPPDVQQYKCCERLANRGKQEVPEYLIDYISFAIMHDPVITKTGQSYDRSTILEHLKRSRTDPLTREPLQIEDVRPNLALKQACEEFLEHNGWAVDW